jgi:hypothetical protein
MVVGPAHGRGDRGRDVAVLDQLDARTRLADLLDQVVMAWAVEDDRRHVADGPAERVRDRPDVRGDGLRERDAPARDRSDGHLAHVHVRKRGQRPTRADRDHGDGVVPAACDDAPALERVEREVDLLPTRADDGVRGKVLGVLGAADHDPSADRELVQ